MTSKLSTILFIALAACVGGAPDGGDGGGDNPGGDNPGGDNPGGGGDATATDVIEKMASTDCEQAHACKSSFPTDWGVTFDQAFGANVNACIADAEAYYNPTAVEAAITAGKIDFDAAAASDCVSAIAAMAAPNCAMLWDQGPAYPDSCFEVFTGKVAVGGSCTVDFECANGNMCGMTGKCEVAQEERAQADGRQVHPSLMLQLVASARSE